MSLNSELFIHPTDRAAMKALKAIPGFSQFIKAYMSVWNERQYRIMNMSSNLKTSDKQLKKYYTMLPPICEKLGIDVPDLYVELNVNANAYTYGDNNPFIVVTSGLFETMPEELIPTVLAHECGHIACHHTMYTTMGRMILKGAANIPGYASLVTTPLQIAFAYWMRCSELSADRAAVIYDGTPDKMIQACMRFAGYDKDIQDEANVDAFLEQAEEYLAMVADNKWDKTLEFLMFNQNDHPLNAVRAYECREWGRSEQYKKIRNYLSNGNADQLYVREIPTTVASRELVGLSRDDAASQLREMGFTNISVIRTMEKSRPVKPLQVTALTVDNEDGFDKGDWLPKNAEIILTYFEAETEEEAIAAHPGMLPAPDAAKRYPGRNVNEVVNTFADAGFTNIITEPENARKGLFVIDGMVTRITIAGQNKFDKGDWFDRGAVVRINYLKVVGEKA